MSKPEFTVLLPVHRPPHFLPYAIESVLAQEHRDFELLVICDGAPEATASCAREAARRDARIRVHVHPKGERHGEAYRHQALQSAEGRYVCHISDDDLWFPNHLSEMARLLQEVDFGNVPQVRILVNGAAFVQLGDLALEATRARMRGSQFNFFGPTHAGYRLETYRRLPEGWTPAPPGLWTDLHMWRKFLALPGISAATRVAITALHFPAAPRAGWPTEKWAGEISHWAEIARDERARDRVSQKLLLQMMLGDIVGRSRDRAPKGGGGSLPE
jgi:glycosyltransferase involved in cell wall biosynthesis